MRTILFAVTAACGVGMFGTPGPAVAQVEFYQEGNRLYQEGDFEGALAWAEADGWAGPGGQASDIRFKLCFKPRLDQIEW